MLGVSIQNACTVVNKNEAVLNDVKLLNFFFFLRNPPLLLCFLFLSLLHQVLMVRFASLFDAKERTVTFLSGKKYSVDDLHSMGAGDLLNSMFEFSEKLNALQLSDEEMSLFTAVVLVSAGKERRVIYVLAKF